MRDVSFRPEGYLRFDLHQGFLSSADEERLVVVPARLFAVAGQTAQLQQAARQWGETQGALVARLMGGDPLQEPPERFASELAHLMATLGWGWCELESWGGVLLVVVHGALEGDGVQVLAEFLAGVFSAASGKQFGAVPLVEDQAVRVVMTAAESAAAISRWVREGATLPQVVARMRAGEHRQEGEGQAVVS